MDIAYQEIHHCTWEEYKRKLAEMRKIGEKLDAEIKRDREQSIIEWKENFHSDEAIQGLSKKNVIAYCYEKGKKCVFPQQLADWKKCVLDEAESEDYTNCLEDAVELMEALEEGKPVEEVVNMLNNQGHSNRTIYITKAIVFNFSKRGAEFLRATFRGYIPEQRMEEIIEREKEISRLESLQSEQERQRRV